MYTVHHVRGLGKAKSSRSVRNKFTPFERLRVDQTLTQRTLTNASLAGARCSTRARASVECVRGAAQCGRLMTHMSEHLVDAVLLNDLEHRHDAAHARSAHAQGRSASAPPGALPRDLVRLPTFLLARFSFISPLSSLLSVLGRDAVAAVLASLHALAQARPHITVHRLSLAFLPPSD